MKKIFFFLCSFLLVGFKVPNNNDTPIIVHFEQILNEYRISNGLNPVKIDRSMKEFTDLRSKDLLTDFSHNGFTENIHSYISGFTYGVENLAKIFIPEKNDAKNWFSNTKESQEFFNKISSGTATDYDIAKHCFLVWKRSESHNKQLLDGKIKRFHLSYQKIKNHYYFCFIALN
jgi:uncharacterized protein YkwD